MSEYTTLVFKTVTPGERSRVRKLSQLNNCRAWSMDHELIRLELIENALDENNIELAKSYFGIIDVYKLRERLGVSK